MLQLLSLPNLCLVEIFHLIICWDGFSQLFFTGAFLILVKSVVRLSCDSGCTPEKPLPVLLGWAIVHV